MVVILLSNISVIVVGNSGIGNVVGIFEGNVVNIVVGIVVNIVVGIVVNIVVGIVVNIVVGIVVNIVVGIVVNIVVGISYNSPKNWVFNLSSHISIITISFVSYTKEEKAYWEQSFIKSYVSLVYCPFTLKYSSSFNILIFVVDWKQYKKNSLEIV